MSNLSQSELLEYIKTAIGVETDLATQEQILNQCCADIQQRKPILQLQELPNVPDVENGESSYALGIFYLTMGLIFFGCLPIDGSPAWLCLLAGIPFAIVGVLMIRNVSKRKARNNEKLLIHEQRVAIINKENEKREKAYYEAVHQCSDSEHIICAEIQPHIMETRILLAKLYDKGIIYRKYCTLPALTSIYEYFITGRCTELTGLHGAYNLYEDELRKDTVISQLNTVIENLEQIRNNQYMLYQQVKIIQENTNVIVSELRQIKGYTIQTAQLTALNAYYSALNERNTRITMWNTI